MKRTRICPKCNGTDIIRIEGKAGAYGVGNNIQVGWSNFSAVATLSCGKAKVSW